LVSEISLEKIRREVPLKHERFLVKIQQREIFKILSSQILRSFRITTGSELGKRLEVDSMLQTQTIAEPSDSLISKIQEFLLVSARKPSVSRIVGSFEFAGTIERRPDVQDPPQLVEIKNDERRGNLEGAFAAAYCIRHRFQRSIGGFGTVLAYRRNNVSGIPGREWHEHKPPWWSLKLPKHHQRGSTQSQTHIRAGLSPNQAEFLKQKPLYFDIYRLSARVVFAIVPGQQPVDTDS
jgi:hypothetical protein